MRLINNNKCLSKHICLQNIFLTSVINDVSTFYLDWVFFLPMQKMRGFCPGGGWLVRGGFGRGFFFPEGFLSYIRTNISQSTNQFIDKAISYK